MQQNLWYAKTIPEIFQELNSQEHGLTKEQVALGLAKYGLNKIPEEKVDGFPIIFLRQFQSPLIYILLVVAIIVFITGEIGDSIVIAAVLLFNAIIGTIQEGKAQNTLLALKKFTETTANVIRDGKEMTIKDEELIPGDIIVLQEGEKIPADARLILVNNLIVDESSLTGESKGVHKNNETLKSNNPILMVDQKNMIFKGTHVASGNGTAVVITTGTETEIGKIAQKIATVDSEIPLKANIRYLSRLIIIITVITSIILIAIGMMSGKPLREMFTTVIALSVSIIPEGLPVVMTLVLATGVWRMSKRNVLVKRLQAVEALGQTKIIAVDKTGTLTMNEMIIDAVYVDGQNFKVTGNGYDSKGEISLGDKIVDPLNHPELLLSGKVANFCANARVSFIEETNTWKVTGDPTEAAMLVFSEKIGYYHETLEEESPKIFELPFDYNKKYHIAIREMEGKNFLAAVGAPETILDLCGHLWHKDGTKKLNEENKRELEAVFNTLAQNGSRVIAYAIHEDSSASVEPDKIPKLTFVGFFCMRDALRSEVRESMEKVREADIKVVMITGDHRITAQAIAKEADIWREGDIVLTGEEIDNMNEEELASKLSHTSVFARVTPDHKLRIIQAYRKRGEIVAMTGDGVNDAPSLVAADLGVSMGKIGTEIAKEASDIVLLDDNFASIVSAAEEGRGIYKTIKKVILYLFSTSVGEVMVITFAIILQYPLPVIATQIIWLNFVTDGFLDVALAMEPKDKGLMHGKFAHPKKWIVDGLMMKRILIMALPMTIGTLYLFKIYLDIDMEKALTISLTSLAIFQWFNAWNCKSETKSIFKTNPFANKYLVGATIIVASLQVLAVYNPLMQKLLHTTALDFSEWIMIIGVASSIILVEEIRKGFGLLKTA